MQDTERQDRHTHITSEQRRSFEAPVSRAFDNCALFSCFVKGEPAYGEGAMVLAISFLLPRSRKCPCYEMLASLEPANDRGSSRLRVNESVAHFRGCRQLFRFLAARAAGSTAPPAPDSACGAEGPLA
jgi:hypothetical protein